MKLDKYKTFDDYLFSGEFERLSDENKVKAYNFFFKKESDKSNLRSISLSSDLIDLTEEELPEDRQILQPDGSRACINWELVDRGFHLVE